MYNNAYAKLNITKAAYETIAAIEKELSDAFSAIEENESINEAKVLAAFPVLQYSGVGASQK